MSIDSLAALLKQAENWRFENFPLPEGGQMRHAFWPAVAPQKGHVLLIPGAGEYIEKYTELAMDWAQRGYSATCFDWRGQGGSSRFTRKNMHILHVPSFDLLVGDLYYFWQKIWRPRLDGAPAFILAHSTGAHLFLRHLIENQISQDLVPVFLTSPLMDIPKTVPLPRAVIQVVIEIIGRILPECYALDRGPYNPKAPQHLTHDKARAAWWKGLRLEKKELTTGGQSWGWVLAATQSCRRLKAELPQLPLRPTVFSTPDDVVVDASAQELLAPYSQFQNFPGAHHELLMEEDSLRQSLFTIIERRVNTP